VELYVDDLLVARGEVLVVNDCFCVRITEVFAQHGVEDAGA
jgi:flagellar motor switch/type III secretory pathway protein FliN